MKEICRNCANYSAYYRRRVCSFEKEDFGKCVKHKEQRKWTETCANYICNIEKQKSIQEVAIKQLVYALTSIEDIATILKEINKEAN